MLGLALAYPYMVGDLKSLGTIGDFFPALGNTVVIILVFTMMAVGLNVVVGYAACSTWGTSPSTPPAPTPPAGSRRASSSR